jgi:hypothetical protein
MSDFSAKITLSLFPAKEKKSDKSPDMGGDIEIPASAISELVTYLRTADSEMNWKDEPVVKLRASVWSNEMKNGGKYLKGLVSPPLEKTQASSAPATSNNNLPF